MPFVTYDIRVVFDLRHKPSSVSRVEDADDRLATMAYLPCFYALPSLKDLPAIVALERTPAAREFVGQWSQERHAATFEGGDARYYVSETEAGEVQGYAILRGLQETSRAIELKRIVVAVPERGLGRRMLKELMRIAFRELGAHRFYLDVYEDNARARHVYESLGFRYEGVMREAANRDGQWCNLHLMSILESEFGGI